MSSYATFRLSSLEVENDDDDRPATGRMIDSRCIVELARNRPLSGPVSRSAASHRVPPFAQHTPAHYTTD